MKNLFLFIVICILLTIACEKPNQLPVQTDEVEIYLMKDFVMKDSTRQIIDSSIVLDEHPLINYSQIVGYDSTEKAFIVTPQAKQSLLNTMQGYYLTPFAVTVNKEIVYWGYFWPVYMSSISHWISCDPTFYFSDSTEIKMDLGYPTNEYTFLKVDPRNDSRLIQVLKSDGKLK